MTAPAPRVTRPLLLLALVTTLVTGLVTTGPLPSRAVAPDPIGVWPLEPEPDVVHDFDPPDSTYGAGHRGVDLAGHVGQHVRSALPGTVVFSGVIAGKAVVVVGHGPTRTTYEPVSGSVPVGTGVPAGAVIGMLRLPGSHCFPAACLHWGWLEGDTYLDPLRLVDGPIRLLPLWQETPVRPVQPVWPQQWLLRLAGAPAGRPFAVGPW